MWYAACWWEGKILWELWYQGTLSLQRNRSWFVLRIVISLKNKQCALYQSLTMIALHKTQNEGLNWNCRCWSPPSFVCSGNFISRYWIAKLINEYLIIQHYTYKSLKKIYHRMDGFSYINWNHYGHIHDWIVKIDYIN